MTRARMSGRSTTTPVPEERLGTRTSCTIGTGAGAVGGVTSRRNRDDHHRSVPTLIPSCAANTAAVSPLALHSATRFCHVTFAAFVIGSHPAVSRAITPERCSCSGYDDLDPNSKTEEPDR